MADHELTMAGAGVTPSNHICGIFLGLEGLPNGTINFQFVRAVGDQDPITSADVDVTFVLVFGTQGPTWPSFTNGNFDPPWLAQTKMGKTLHVVDRLLGRLSDATMPRPDEGSAVAKELVGEFHQADHEIKNLQNEQINTRRHLVRPETIYRTWSKLDDGTLRCQMHQVQMRIDVTGASAQPINQPTDEYDRLATRWPILERYRQLIGLLYAIHELREQGFCPSHILRESITANEIAFLNGTYAPAAPEFVTEGPRE